MIEDAMEEVTATTYESYAFGICLFFVVGIVLQSLNWYSLLHRENRQKGLTPYLLSIAFANFVFLLSSFPSSFLSALHHGWIFNEGFCVVEGFVSGTSSIAMICLLSVIVVKTSNAITKVSHANRISTRYRSCKKDIAFVWLYSIAAMLPPLVGLTTMSLEGGGTNCAPNWRPTNTPDILYALILTVMVFVVPIIVCLVYFTKIYRYLVKHREICKQRINYTNKQRHLMDYTNISKMVAASIFVYVLMWTPYCIGVLISVFGGSDQLLNGHISLVPTLFAKSSAVFSPIVYFTFNVRFRRQVMKIFKCHVKKRPSRVLPLTKTKAETTVEKTNLHPYPERIQVQTLETLDSQIEEAYRSCIDEEKEPHFHSLSSATNRHVERRDAVSLSLDMKKLDSSLDFLSSLSR